jgi:hypothetical protein
MKSIDYRNCLKRMQCDYSHANADSALVNSEWG